MVVYPEEIVEMANLLMKDIAESIAELHQRVDMLTEKD